MGSSAVSSLFRSQPCRHGGQRQSRRSVLVVVIVVGGVAAAVMDIVDVVTVGYGYVTTAIAVAVIMVIVGGVLAVRWFTFVVVTVVLSVQVPVMNVVDMIPVRDGDVSALLAVGMVVIQMLGMGLCASHMFASPYCRPG